MHRHWLRSRRTVSALALPAGLLFGWLSLRLGSIWFVAVIHWLTGVSMDWWILNAGPH